MNWKYERKLNHTIEIYINLSQTGGLICLEFIRNLEIPKLEDTVRDELEGEITFKECQDILCTFKREKSPGDDGFTWEFYNCFFDLLRRDLVDSFNSKFNLNASI